LSFASPGNKYLSFVYLTIPVYALIIAYILIERNPFALIVTTDVLGSSDYYSFGFLFFVFLIFK